jgi:hypothetical protein
MGVQRYHAARSETRVCRRRPHPDAERQ